MTTYYPDRWVILKIASGPDADPVYKVLAGWKGGYLDADSWKLNSGISGVRADGDRYLFDGFSGSVYDCSKSGYGMTTLTRSVYSSWIAQLVTSGSSAVIDLIPEESIPSLVSSMSS